MSDEDAKLLETMALAKEAARLVAIAFIGTGADANAAIALCEEGRVRTDQRRPEAIMNGGALGAQAIREAVAEVGERLSQ